MIRWQNGTTRTFKIRRFVIQGSLLSPILFNLYSELMIAKASDDLKGEEFNKKFKNVDNAGLAAYSKQIL